MCRRPATGLECQVAACLQNGIDTDVSSEGSLNPSSALSSSGLAPRAEGLQSPMMMAPTASERDAASS